MPRASASPQHAAPPSLETILRRASEAKGGKVRAKSHAELLRSWAKTRQKAVSRAQEAKRSIQ